MNWRKKDKYKWHRWFAWRPVTIGERRHWLEWVWRERDTYYAGSYWRYRVDPETRWLNVRDTLRRKFRNSFEVRDTHIDLNSVVQQAFNEYNLAYHRIQEDRNNVDRDA